jgi:hypothetical protein
MYTSMGNSLSAALLVDHPALIGNIRAALERVATALASLSAQLLPEAPKPPENFDSKDPAAKFEIGGLQKFTPRGVEICYHLFDAGKSRHAVAVLMNISFGAATHRYRAWVKAGGANRVKAPLN